MHPSCQWQQPNPGFCLIISLQFALYEDACSELGTSLNKNWNALDKLSLFLCYRSFLSTQKFKVKPKIILTIGYRELEPLNRTCLAIHSKFWPNEDRMLTVFVTEFVSAGLVLTMPQWPHSSEIETRTCHQNKTAYGRKELVGNKKQKITEVFIREVFNGEMFLNIFINILCQMIKKLLLKIYLFGDRLENYIGKGERPTQTDPHYLKWRENYCNRQWHLENLFKHLEGLFQNYNGILSIKNLK